jgi:hypothetical protein
MQIILLGIRTVNTVLLSKVLLQLDYDKRHNHIPGALNVNSMYSRQADFKHY